MTPDDLHRSREKELFAAKMSAMAKGETVTWAVTRSDLTRDHRGLPAEQVSASHLYEWFGVQIYDRIEFHDEGRVFILKNRNGPCGEVPPGAVGHNLSTEGE